MGVSYANLEEFKKQSQETAKTLQKMFDFCYKCEIYPSTGSQNDSDFNNIRDSTQFKNLLK